MSSYFSILWQFYLIAGNFRPFLRLARRLLSHYKFLSLIAVCVYFFGVETFSVLTRPSLSQIKGRELFSLQRDGKDQV